ncbi:MAG: ATPase, T2SS/T4P/T4SS family, partial [Christensenella sp.]
MNNDLRIDLIAELKKEIQNMPKLISMSNDELVQTIEQQYARKEAQAKSNNNELFSFLQSRTFKERELMLKSVYDSIRGLDVLGKIMADKSITEVMINGYDHIFVEQNGKLHEIEDKFESSERLTDIIIKFVQASGRAVSESNPIVDTRLEDGSRVNVVLPPIALNGPIVTIRRFPETAMTVDK